MGKVKNTEIFPLGDAIQLPFTHFPTIPPPINICWEVEKVQVSNIINSIINAKGLVLEIELVQGIYTLKFSILSETFERVEPLVPNMFSPTHKLEGHGSMNSINSNFNLITKGDLAICLFSKVEIEFLTTSENEFIYFSLANINIGYSALYSQMERSGPYYTIKAEVNIFDTNSNGMITTDSTQPMLPVMILAAPCPPLWRPEISPAFNPYRIANAIDGPGHS